ncbi:MAG: glutathione S-transferase family protein [Pseudomonadota bacterium]
MLTLLTFPSGLGVSAYSPFAVKSEVLLVMSGIQYTKEFPMVTKMPRSKIPVLKDGERLIPDTAHIQTYLEQEQGVDFDSHLSAEQLATATAFRGMMENHLYFINAYFRWIDHPKAVHDTYFVEVPKLLRGLIFKAALKQVHKTLHLQGLGRHSRDELIAFGRKDVQALADQLGDKPYFLGDQPSSIDAMVYGTLTNMVDCELDTPTKRDCLKHENLLAYLANFKATVLTGKAI